MKKSDLLRTARDLLARGSRDTVCSALDGVVMLSPGARNQVYELQEWVMEMLGTCLSYEAWLHKNALEFLLSQHIIIVPGESHRTCLPGRLAWMAWMISYWEEQEIPF